MKKHLLILVGIISLGACSKPAVQYQTYEVGKRTLSKNVEANGSIETLDTVDVLPPVAGRLEHIYVKEGDVVKRRQKVADMSSDSRSLILDMSASQNKDDESYWQKQILRTPIFAPVSGKIIMFRSGVGDRVAGSIAQISTGEIIRANVDEADLPEIKLNQNVDIRFDINSKATMVGKLQKISQVSKLINNVNVYEVEVALPPEDQRKKVPFEIKIGMSVTLYFAVNVVTDASALPINAVEGKTMTTVNLTTVDGREVKAKLGDIYGDWVEVVSGLSPGDKIKVPVFKAQQQKTRKSPLLKN